jgi:hypothetical protein
MEFALDVTIVQVHVWEGVYGGQPYFLRSTREFLLRFYGSVRYRVVCGERIPREPLKDDDR